MPDAIPNFQNESEKGHHFNIVKIETLAELTELITKLSKEDLIYRGVHDSTYKVFSSYHRYLHLNKGSNSYLVGELSLKDSKVMNAQIDKIVSSCSFRRNYMRIADDYAKANGGRYRLDTGHFRYCFHSLSKMQHYDACTFMVDFSHNIYVGLLFSVLKHRKAPYVSLITFPKALVPPVNLNDIPADVETYTERGLLVRQINDPGLLKGKLYQVGLNLLLRPLVLFIDAEEKYLRNRRQKSQQGCFLLYDPIGAHGIMNDGLESLINSTFYNPSNPSSEKFTSYEIASSLIPEIKAILRAKGVTPFKLGLNKYILNCW